MKPIERGEVLGLAEYEQVRERFRARVVADKKLRRVQLGPVVSVVFESHDTALLQVQEMLRTERITRPPAVQHEIDTYNELVPGENELSCTLMIEIPDKAEREAFLVAAKGIERHVWIATGTLRVGATATHRDGADQDRTTAVHYLKFKLPPPLVRALRGGASGEQTLTHIEIIVDHPTYAAEVTLPAETLMAVGQDLES
jgi:Protein of unknown function (DUF3501)